MGIGLLLVNLVSPGTGVDQAAGFVPQQISRIADVTAGDVIGRFIPTSGVSAVLSGNFFGIILFSLAFGLILSTLGAQQRVIVDFFRGLRDAMIKLVPYLFYAAPIGLFFLVGQAVASADISGSAAFAQLGNYLLVVFGALLIQGVIVLPLILKYFCNRSPIEYFGKFFPAFGTALGTGSSIATLPVTYECAVDNARVDNRACALVLPLGATVNLDGSAITGVVVAMFVAQVFGIDLSVVQTLMILGATLLVSIGTAGLPGASLISAAIVFNIAGFPPEAYAGLGLVIAADWLVDRGRAVINVWSDAVGAAFVDQRMKDAALAASRSLTRPQRGVTRDSRDGYRRNDSRGRDRRSGGGRYDRERGSRQNDDRNRSDSPERSNGQERRDDRGRERYSNRSEKQDQPSPFAMSTDRSNFDQDASKPVTQETPEREPKTSSRSTSSLKTERSSTTDDQTSGRKRAPSDRQRQSRSRRSTESGPDKRVRRPRPTAQPVAVENVTSPATAQSSNELNPTTLERERERVNAQLASLKQNERYTRSKTDEDMKDKSVEPRNVDRVKPIGDAFPHIDYEATDIKTEPVEKPIPVQHVETPIIKEQPLVTVADTGSTNETVNQDRSPEKSSTQVVEAVVSSDSDDSSASSETSFGRKRVRKGEKFKGGSAKSETSSPESAESEPSGDTKHPDPGTYNVEKQSFGRAKKKRTR
jgi:Na+/H+-dicarboxylate symporter